MADGTVTAPDRGTVKLRVAEADDSEGVVLDQDTFRGPAVRGSEGVIPLGPALRILHGPTGTLIPSRQ